MLPKKIGAKVRIINESRKKNTKKFLKRLKILHFMAFPSKTLSI